jgi:hypothetical protein
MPDDLSKDPHPSGIPPAALPDDHPGKEEPGEFTRIFQSLQSPRATAPRTAEPSPQPTASRTPLDISQLLRSIDSKDPSLAVPTPVASETMALPNSQSSASPESFTEMFQALSPEPVASPVTHPQGNAAGKLSAQPPAQDAASFTQVLNSLLRPAVNSPAPPPPEKQSPEAILQQHSTSSAARVDRDNEVTKIFAAVSHPQPAPPEPTRSALQRYLPLLLLLNGALMAILGFLVFLFLKHH